MNARQWMDNGYKAIIRRSVVWLYKANSAAAYCRPVDNGAWMDNDQPEPWENGSRWTLKHLTQEQWQDFNATVRGCYCYQGVGRCDFCNGIRSAAVANC